MSGLPVNLPLDLSRVPEVDITSETGVFGVGYDQDNPPSLVRYKVPGSADAPLTAADVGAAESDLSNYSGTAEQLRTLSDSAKADLSEPAQQAAIKSYPFGNAARGTFIYDDFNRADSASLGTTASGHVWALTGAGAANAVITSGRYVNTTTNFSYAYLDFGAALPRISGTFSFVKQAGTTSRSFTAITLIADQSGTSGGLQNMLHLRVSLDTWVLEKRLGGGAFTAIAQGNHTLTEGVAYEIAMDIDAAGGTCVIYPPQAAPVSVSDADITTINPRYGCWEINNGPSSFLGRWEAVTMGLSQGRRLAPVGGSAPGSDLAVAIGGDGTKRRRLSFTAPSVGWYKVATHVSRVTNIISGQVIIGSRDSLRYTKWEMDVLARASGTPRLAHRTLDLWQGGPLNSVRLSNNGTNSVQFDVYAAQVNAVTTIDFIGDFEVVEQPTVGATALSTATTLSVSGSITQLPTNVFGIVGWTANGDADYSIAAGSSTITQATTTALTADRAVTLSTGNAWSGAKFRIVRTAASTGAFNLNVGTGPLKALATGQWCEVEFNGSAWALAAFGSL